MALFGVRTAACAAALWVAGGCLALADPPPWGHGHGHTRAFEAASPGAHGVLSGTVVGIDYAMGSILVATSRGVVPLAVTPSTSIFRGSGFGSLADLARGARVSIDFSATGGHLIAQIIRVR